MKTQTPEQTRTKILKWANKEHLEVRRYSGRGMFGKECLGITFDSKQDMETLKGQGFPPHRSDQMGKGMIAYWPSIPMAKTVLCDECKQEIPTEQSAEENCFHGEACSLYCEAESCPNCQSRNISGKDCYDCGSLFYYEAGELDPSEDAKEVKRLAAKVEKLEKENKRLKAQIQTMRDEHNQK